MDALSEALNAVRMTGAIFFNADFTAPWGFASPHAQTIAHILAPGSERLVLYHLVTEGEALFRMEGAEDLHVAAGDIVVFPHGDPHTMSNGSPSTLLDSAALGKLLSADLRMAQYGGGGAATRFVCGYFGCERHADRLFLAGLPPMIKINVRGDAAGEWLENSIRHLVSEAAAPDAPDRMVLLSKMAEALFIETCAATWSNCRPSRPAGSRARGTPWSAPPLPPCTGSLAILGPRRNWPLRPGPRARSSRSGSPGFSASRR